jgi:hypothetical protein
MNSRTATRSWARRSAILGCAALVLGASSLGLAQGASAAKKKAQPAPIIAVANGTVGIASTVTVSAPALANQTVNALLTYNGVGVGQLAFFLNANGSGSSSWTPSQPGQWTISGLGGLSKATAITVTEAAVTTYTTLATVNQAQAGTPTTMIVTVAPTAGNYQPTGTVTISNGAGTTYGTATLEPYGSGLSYASFSWNPPSVGTYNFTATYNQTAGALASSSSDSTNVIASVPLVTLRVPTQFTVGEPVPLSAVINNSPNFTGSAGFSIINGNTQNFIGGSVGLNPNGVATTAWTPSITGYQVVQANVSNTGNTVSGVATQGISVAAPGAPDPMSVSAPNLGTLRVNVPVTAKAGSRLPVSTQSGSGAAVNLSEGGPCFIQATTLVVPSGRGTCTITASSPGGNGFSSNSATFVINYS